jgi:poly [ADP-ribose] polymerase 2/3/4
MGRPKRAAAAPSAPKPKPFDGFKLALSGKFNSIGYSQSQLETVVKDLGGSVGPRVDGSTTHLVCTRDDFDKQTTKVVAAQDKDLPIVNSDWLLECSEKEQLLSVDNYVFSAQQKNGTVSDAQSASAPAPAPSSTKTTVPSRGKKRKADDEDEDSKDDSQQKKKAANGSDMNGEEEVKEVAEGQYIKKRDFAIPVDEHCPHSNRAVYIDPDSGMIYDASLNQSNSSHNNNKFYRVQVSPLISQACKRHDQLLMQYVHLDCIRCTEEGV